MGDGLGAASAAVWLLARLLEALETRGFDCFVAVFCCLDGGSLTDDVGVGGARDIFFLDDGLLLPLLQTWWLLLLLAQLAVAL